MGFQGLGFRGLGFRFQRFAGLECWGAGLEYGKKGIQNDLRASRAVSVQAAATIISPSVECKLKLRQKKDCQVLVAVRKTFFQSEKQKLHARCQC